jgi:hypothetical protein
MNNSDYESKGKKWWNLLQKDVGPIPRGCYTIDTNKIANPDRKGDERRNRRGDWGDWQAPIKPSPGTDTYGRDGFWLHGGSRPGTNGCIDIGGGTYGNSVTDRVLGDLMSDSDGNVPLNVK